MCFILNFKKVMAVVAGLAVLMVVISVVLVTSIKVDRLAEADFRDEFSSQFIEDFIAFHSGDKEALVEYEDVRVRNYQVGVLRRETAKFNLLQRAIWDRSQVVTDFGQSAQVHPDEEVVLNEEGLGEEKLEGQALIDYIMSLPYDEEKLDVVYDEVGNVTKVLYDPSQSKVVTEYVEVLFAGSREQIFRNEMSFNYEDMQGQPMYNSLKKVNESVTAVDGGKYRYVFKLDSLVQTGFNIVITFEGKEVVSIEMAEFRN